MVRVPHTVLGLFWLCIRSLLTLMHTITGKSMVRVPHSAATTVLGLFWLCIRSLLTLAMLYREGHGPCPPYCRDYSAAYYHLDQVTCV
jgi:hypothetical protein